MLKRLAFHRRIFLVPALMVALAAGGALLQGCSVNPATGEQSFTAFMSPSQEMEIGAEEHPKVMKEFGGAYEDPEIRRYVTSIGRFLASSSELPDLPFTFTVLDSPVVNAFALPGGYVYATRGLMALANIAVILARERLADFQTTLFRVSMLTGWVLLLALMVSESASNALGI